MEQSLISIIRISDVNDYALQITEKEGNVSVKENQTMGMCEGLPVLSLLCMGFPLPPRFPLFPSGLLVVPGTEPGASCMLNKQSITGLHPHIFAFYICTYKTILFVINVYVFADFYI